MKPAPFRYCAVETVDQAVAALVEHGDEAKVLAGGQSLVPLMNLRLAMPSVLVDVNRIAELDGVRANGAVEIGALTRQAVAERDGGVPLLSEALHHVSNPGLRQRGTVGGSAAHADPAAEIPAVLLALEAELVAVGPEGERVIPADEFFVSSFTTALRPDELLTRIRIPRAPERWGFTEVARHHGDFALVGVAVADGRIALFGVGHRAIRVPAAEEALAAGSPDDAARLAAEAVELREDAFTSRGYRREVARVLVGRALEQAAAR